jgi:hypothetical protein
MKSSFVRLAFVAALVASGCANTVQGTVDSIVGDIDGLLGVATPYGEHCRRIRDVHEEKRWAFRSDAEDALEVTRAAVRGLATCDYATWREAATVVGILSEMADQHQSSLVRAEALDTLTHMADWALKAEATAEPSTTYADVIEGMKVVKDAVGRGDDDPAFTFKVQGAVAAIANHPYDRVELPREGGLDNRAVARVLATQLGKARAALKVIDGRALDGFLADAGVHDALDRAYVSLGGVVIRLTLLKAAIGDAVETTRVAAIRDVATLAPEGGGPVLRRILIYDGYASVRREAAKAIAAYATTTSVPALVDGLADEMADVRGAAASSLASVTGQRYGDDRGAWLRWWQSNGTKPQTPAPEGGSPQRN